MLLVGYIIVILFFVYLAVCGLFWLFQRKFLFYPQPASALQVIKSQAVKVQVEEIVFNDDGQQLEGWVVNPGKDKAMLYYGGNKSAIEQHIVFLSASCPEYTLYLIPYRGYGKNLGVPTEKHLFADALFIYDEVVAHHQTISLYGRSLGSGVAVYVASNRPVESLILVTPYDSIQNVAKNHYPFLPKWLLKDKFLSFKSAKKVKSRTLIISAENDTVIRQERTEQLIRNFNPLILSKLVIFGAQHNDISEFSEFGSSVRKFLNKGSFNIH